jgi:pimeloyl-ACP methyl ester carboxylesterase
MKLAGWISLVLITLSVAVWHYGEYRYTNEDSPAKTSIPCRIQGYAYEITCGHLEVADQENTSRPLSNEIRWYRIPARSRYGMPDPVIWIPGFGIDAEERAPAMASILKRIMNTRDLIWLMPRGTPRTDKDACMKAGIKTLNEHLNPLSDNDLLERCQGFMAEHVGSYSSAELYAHDLEQLRVKLNLDQVNVLAEGSGAEVALRWMQLSPDAIRVTVLDSPVLIESAKPELRASRSESALRQAFSACVETSECALEHTDPYVNLQRVLMGLPRTLDIVNPQTSVPESVHVTRENLAGLMTRILSHPPRAAMLPTAVYEAANGNWNPLFGLYEATLPAPNKTFHWEVWLAAYCSRHSAGPGVLESDLASWFYSAERDQFHRLCGEDLPQMTPIDSMSFDSPVLVLRGGADPIVSDLPFDVHEVRVPGGGHGILTYGCASDVIYRFIQSNGAAIQDSGLGAGCLEQVPYPLPLQNIGRKQ